MDDWKTRLRAAAEEAIAFPGLTIEIGTMGFLVQGRVGDFRAQRVVPFADIDRGRFNALLLTVRNVAGDLRIVKRKPA